MSVSIAFNNNQCFGRKSVCLIEFIIWLSTVVGRTLWRRWVPGYRWLMYVQWLHANRLSIGIVVITSAALYHPPCRCTDFVKIRSTLIPQFHSQSSSPPNMRRIHGCRLFGDRAFPVTADRVWNELPRNVTSALSCRGLKGGGAGGRPQLAQNFSVGRLFPYKRHIVCCVHLR